jgi:hypothetical protein
MKKFASWKPRLRVVMLVMLASVMAIVTAGCQMVEGVNLNKALLKNVSAQSMIGNTTISLEIDADPENLPTDEKSAAMLEMFKQMTLAFTDIKMQDPEHISFNGKFSFSKGTFPFAMALAGEQMVIQMDGAKKPIVIDNSMEARGIPSPISAEAMANLQNTLKNPKFIEPFYDFFIRHLPNPNDIKVTRVTDSINNQTLSLNKVETTVKGEELLPLVTEYISSLMEDDEGMKQVIGLLYDALKPIITELKAQADLEEIPNPLVQSILSIMDQDRTIAVNLIHTFAKQGLVFALAGLDSVKDQEDGLKAILNDQTYVKTSIYIDNSLNVRKSEQEFVIAPQTEFNDGIRSVKLNVTSEAWAYNEPVKADLLDTTDALVVGPDMTAYDFLNNLDENSELYKLLKNDLKITQRNVYLFVEAEEPTEGFNRPFVRDGVTYVPARFVAEELHAKVEWDGDRRIVTIRSADGETTIQFEVEGRTALVNGTSVELEGRAALINGSAYVPVRFLVEAFGGTITWEQDLQMIEIQVD